MIQAKVTKFGYYSIAPHIFSDVTPMLQINSLFFENQIDEQQPIVVMYGQYPFGYFILSSFVEKLLQSKYIKSGSNILNGYVSLISLYVDE